MSMWASRSGRSMTSPTARRDKSMPSIDFANLRVSRILNGAMPPVRVSHRYFSERQCSACLHRIALNCGNFSGLVRLWQLSCLSDSEFIVGLAGIGCGQGQRSDASQRSAIRRRLWTSRTPRTDAVTSSARRF